jgi:NADPH:quinone reductase-like Zn-dependent oxidoreductase
MRWDEVPDPDPAPDEVILDVHVCGVNHSDLDSRAGTSRWTFRFPWVLGAEFAGHVSALGSDVEGVRVGDPATAYGHYACGRCDACGRWREDLCRSLALFGTDVWGGYAERVRVPARALVALRSADDFIPAAAGQWVSSTAWHMVTALARVNAGETVLVPSASGGVAGALVQCAKIAGARVLASVGAPEKIEAVRALGADVVFSYRDRTVADVVREETDGQGVDAVLDTVGGALFPQHLAALRADGRLATCGAHAGEIVELDVVRLFQNGHRILGFRLATPEEIRAALAFVLAGRIRVPVAGTFALSEAGEAHAFMERREHVGKIVLVRP